MTRLGPGSADRDTGLGGLRSCEGLVAVVTGGASGIGHAAAAELATQGARVAVLDIAAVPADDRILALNADVTDPRSVQSAVDAAASALSGLDIVVNCAGVGASGSLESSGWDLWARVLDVNLLGTARVCRAALPYLRSSRAASIVNVGSIAADVGLPDRAIYSASKGAVHAFGRALAADCVTSGIRINTVAPGTADTPWVARLLADAADPGQLAADLAARQPHGRLVAAAEVAAAIVYLAGRGSGSTTGTTLYVDGGMAGLRVPELSSR